MRIRQAFLALLLLFAFAHVNTGSAQQKPRPGRFLLVWAGDADRKHDDFLAVVDARSGSPTFGRVLKTVPVGSSGNEPHHIDFDSRTDGTLWASGVLTGRIFIFNVSRLPKVKLLKVIEPTPAQVHAPPHTFGLLPNGNTIVTAMEMLPHHRMGESRQPSGGDPAPGGLLEFDKRGNFLRRISAADPQAGDAEISPYGLALKADVDRMVTTNSGHGWLPTMKQMTDGYTVQVWRVSDLQLLRTIKFPNGSRGGENAAPYEPRFAHARGSQTVFINSVVGCALYVSTDIASADPKFQLVYDFGKDSVPAYPMLTQDDRYYIQPLTTANKVVVLDVRDPLHPKQVGEVRFDRDPANPSQARQGQPHYLVLDRDERRAAVSDYTLDLPSFVGDGDRRVYLLKFDPKTGALQFDQAFKDEVTKAVGIEFGREVWPHGRTGAARPHGMMFLP
jgi:hypothetical protein